MGLFDSSKNITDIPVNLLFKHLSNDCTWVFGDSCIWFIEITKTITDSGPMNEVRRTNFAVVCKYYEDIENVMKRFDEDFDKLMINPDAEKTIPEQFGDVMKSYLPSGSRLQITPTKYFISFNNHIHEFFNDIYQGYCLRHRMGQRGYDVQPEKIGYLHVQFTSDECNINIPPDAVLTIHWFYPLAMVER